MLTTKQLIEERLNNPEIKKKGANYTRIDLHRTYHVILSVQKPNCYATEHTSSWWSDHKILQFDYPRYYLGIERKDKTKIFKYPSMDTINNHIFPFFNDTPAIQKYIINNANQHNFSCAARTAVTDQTISAGFAFHGSSTDKTSLEFRKNIDGSVSVFEKFYLKNSVMNINTDQMLESPLKHTACILARTRIAEENGKIHHTLEYFSIKSIDETFVKTFFNSEDFPDLKKYIDNDNDMELGIHVTETSIENAETEKDWVLINQLQEKTKFEDSLQSEFDEKEFSESVQIRIDESKNRKKNRYF